VRVRVKTKTLFLALSFLLARSALAIPRVTEGDFVLRDFRFGSGETLPELRIHYRTLGAPRRDAKGVVKNAVLILHGTTGSGKQFLTDNFAGVLFGPGQLLDAESHYLILPDGIGHGDSSRPSDGLRARFPHYTYADMVVVQYRLLTEGLGIAHLHLVLGTSMGRMHTWMWAEKYPDFMDGLVPLACLPVQIAGRNRAWRKMISDDIRIDPDWKQGDYERQPRSLTTAVQLMVLMVGNPLQWQKAAPTREDADRYLAGQMGTRLAAVDANNLLYAFEASREYDPAPGLERIEKPLVAINFADDEINPPQLSVLPSLMSRVRLGRYVLIPASEQTRGHSTHSYPIFWQEHLKVLLAQLPN
jgi:homoserine O-acetyltransferase/O-succinyltransferase